MRVVDILKERSGARWTRVDLHLHSPGVSSFRCPDGADLKSEKGRQEVAKGYVQKCAASGTRVAAITDYNGIGEEWFSLIRGMAAERNIVSFHGRSFLSRKASTAS